MINYGTLTAWMLCSGTHVFHLKWWISNVMILVVFQIFIFVLIFEYLEFQMKSISEFFYLSIHVIRSNSEFQMKFKFSKGTKKILNAKSLWLTDQIVSNPYPIFSGSDLFFLWSISVLLTFELDRTGPDIRFIRSPIQLYIN